MAKMLWSTCSSGAKVADVDGLRAVLARWDWAEDDGVSCDVEIDDDGRIQLHGYATPMPYRLTDARPPEDQNFDVLDVVDFEGFLGEVARYLAEPWAVELVGFEGCRYPHTSGAWHIYPDGRIEEHTLPAVKKEAGLEG